MLQGAQYVGNAMEVATRSVLAAKVVEKQVCHMVATLVMPQATSVVEAVVVPEFNQLRVSYNGKRCSASSPVMVSILQQEVAQSNKSG